MLSDELKEQLGVLRAVLCDPEGSVSIHGSAEDVLAVRAALERIDAVAEAAAREAQGGGDGYKTTLVFTKHDMDREWARLGALIELHIDDSAKLLKMLGVCDGTKENDHWRYRKECFIDFDKVLASIASRPQASATVPEGMVLIEKNKLTKTLLEAFTVLMQALGTQLDHLEQIAQLETMLAATRQDAARAQEVER